MNTTLSLDIRPIVRTLDNGLAVCVARVAGVPLVGMCVLYKVGFRRETRGRAGFAHLFEHLMFEGTPRFPKGVFDRLCEASGGSNNGQTRPDTTVYEDVLPPQALERFLFLEADRMRGLALDEEALANQRDVVKEEIRFNVKNDPHGLFDYCELPSLLFARWENAHDGYGDFGDLDRASLPDAAAFFDAFYRPSNAVVALAGEVEPDEAFAAAKRFFGDLPTGAPPPPPDLLEPPLPAPVRRVSPAPLARTPALAAAWRMPPRGHEDVAPLLVLGDLLHDGRAARLYRGLVERRRIATEVSGGFNPFQGGALYEGTTLFLSRVGYLREVSDAEVIGALEEEVRAVAEGVPEDELQRSKTKTVANLLAGLEPRLEMAVELAHAMVFEGDAAGLLALPARLLAVTPEEVARAAARWLTPGSSAVLVKEPLS